MSSQTASSLASRAPGARAWIAVLVAAIALGVGPTCRPRPAPPGKPPVAARRPHEVRSPHGTRVDPYYWLRDDTRQDPEVLAYLQAENAYKEAVLAPHAATREALYQELVGRLEPELEGLPHGWRGHLYWTRFPQGAEYPLHLRRRDAPGAPDEVLLDEAALADGREFFALGSLEPSPDGRLVAWTEDTTGRRQYVLRFKDLTTGELLPDRLAGLGPGLAWDLAGRVIFYVEKDPVTLRGVRVRRHVLGTDPGEDGVVHEEDDESVYLGVDVTRDDRYVVVHRRSILTDEVRFLPAASPFEPLRLLAPRHPGVKVEVDHAAGRWVIRTNWQARDFKLMQVADDQTGDRARWRDLVPAEEGCFVSAFALFEGYLVVGERRGGVDTLRVRDLGSGGDRRILPEDPAGTTHLEVNADPTARRVRWVDSSLVTPDTTYELDMATGERRMLRRDPVRGGHDPAAYATERLWIEARDGARVPVTLVSRRGRAQTSPAPLYLYGYGAYGHSTTPFFRHHVLSLLDRGFVFALAHVRGGQELGRAWYEDGKLLRKANSFRDFVDVAEGLVARGVASRDQLVASGGSAGGLLVGAATNMRPDLFRVVVAHVPFVDVVTTMLDESIPLTTNEYTEWGDPRQRAFYDAMLAYSPYDNVAARDYPAMLVTTGLWDSQVQYFEPAKWVARLRHRRTDDRHLLLHTDMDAGHGGASGRFRRYQDLAMEYAFVLAELGG